ncbi:MAG: alpha/beta fold hydrolase, partial [Actinomycetota bacterium]
MIEPRHRLIPLSSGVELHVLEWLPTNEPSDTPFLLTHGLASNARLWDGVAWRLAERGHRVIAVDQRGHGRSSKPDGPYDVTTCADDLALLIDSVGFELPPLVAGQSWGGNVVLELGFRHPDSVRLVACVDGGFIDLQERFESWEACATA